MKYAKNVYRNQLTDSHLDDLLRVACSNYKPDLSKIYVKYMPCALYLCFNYKDYKRVYRGDGVIVTAPWQLQYYNYTDTAAADKTERVESFNLSYTMRRTDSQHFSLILKSENTFLNYTKYHTNIKEFILYILHQYCIFVSIGNYKCLTSGTSLMSNQKYDTTIQVPNSLILILQTFNMLNFVDGVNCQRKVTELLKGQTIKKIIKPDISF
ncbi:hypothetical protein QTP88_007335 [Uroleucon formosanum]